MTVNADAKPYSDKNNCRVYSPGNKKSYSHFCREEIRFYHSSDVIEI